MRGIYATVRSWVRDDRVLNSAIAALLIAFVVAYALDLAMDVSWIPEVFFATFVLAYVVLYRSGKAPPMPSGELLNGLGWMLILFVLTLAVLRAYTHIDGAFS
jgi:hypothetical protein